MPEAKIRYSPAEYLTLERESDTRHEYLDGEGYDQHHEGCVGRRRNRNRIPFREIRRRYRERQRGFADSGFGSGTKSLERRGRPAKSPSRAMHGPGELLPRPMHALHDPLEKVRHLMHLMHAVNELCRIPM